jgi:chromosomal replication initiator protein
MEQQILTVETNYYAVPGLKYREEALRCIVLDCNKIIESVCSNFNIDRNSILAPNRGTIDIVTARHCAVYLTHKHTNLSSLAIGRIFGRDHSTILNSIKAFPDILKRDKYVEDKFNAISLELRCIAK